MELLILLVALAVSIYGLRFIRPLVFVLSMHLEAWSKRRAARREARRNDRRRGIDPWF